MSNETTFIDPAFKPCSGRRTVDGILFLSYRMGITRYCQITEDGQIKTKFNAQCSGYHAQVIGHGPVLNHTGKWKTFRTHEGAARAALAIWRKLQTP